MSNEWTNVLKMHIQISQVENILEKILGPSIRPHNLTAMNFWIIYLRSLRVIWKINKLMVLFFTGIWRKLNEIRDVKHVSTCGTKYPIHLYILATVQARPPICINTPTRNLTDKMMVPLQMYCKSIFTDGSSISLGRTLQI